MGKNSTAFHTKRLKLAKTLAVTMFTHSQITHPTETGNLWVCVNVFKIKTLQPLKASSPLFDVKDNVYTLYTSKSLSIKKKNYCEVNTNKIG